MVGALREIDELPLAVSLAGRSQSGIGSIRMRKLRLLSFWARRNSRRHQSHSSQARLTRKRTASQRLAAS